MNAVFDALSLQAAMLDVVAASHATPRLIGERQQQRLVRLLEAARAVPVYRERLGNGRLRSSDLSRMAPVASTYSERLSLLLFGQRTAWPH